MVRTIFTAFIIATVYSLVWPHLVNNIRVDLVVLLLSTSPGALDLLMIIRLNEGWVLLTGMVRGKKGPLQAVGW